MTEAEHRHRHLTDRQLLFLIAQKLDVIDELVEEIRDEGKNTVSAIEDLQSAVNELEGAEQAAVAEFEVLAQEITELKAGSVSTAEVESLAAKAKAVADALKAGTPSGKQE